MKPEETIQKLEKFKVTINEYFKSHDQKIRSQINREKAWIRREVIEAGCFKTFTVSPPPAVGGLIMRDMDPFEFIFNPPYNMSIKPIVFDIIDETIGVIQSGGRQLATNTPKILAETDYEKGYAFVAMAIDPTDPSLEDILDSIKEAANKCGIHAELVDEVQSNNRITDRILESIQKAQFVIVDLTYAKPNVFYEAGYAQGLNKTPIYIAKEGTRLEFDLKDYPVIFFKNMKELKNGLEQRLRSLADQA